MHAPKNTLQLVNEILTRCGQKSVGSLVASATPVKQALSFLNQIYEEMRLSLAMPTLKEQIEIPYTAQQAPLDLSTLNTTSPLLNVNSVWVQAEGSTHWVSLQYEPVETLLDESHRAPAPTQFTLQRDTLRLYPTPTTPGKLRLTLERGIDRLEHDTDIPQLPYGSEYLLILGGVGYLQHFMGETQSSLMTFRLFEEGLLRLKKKYSPLYSALRMQGSRRGYRNP